MQTTQLEQLKERFKYTDEDLVLLRQMFGGNDKALKLLRKVFIQELEPDAPIGTNGDIFLGIDTDEDPIKVTINLKSRNFVIQHIEKHLMQLKDIANRKEKTVEEIVAANIRNSNK